MTWNYLLRGKENSKEYSNGGTGSSPLTTGLRQRTQEGNKFGGHFHFPEQRSKFGLQQCCFDPMDGGEVP